MGKYTIKELLNLNFGRSRLPLNSPFSASEEIVDLRGMNLIAEGMSSGGFGFEIRGIALEGKWGCVDCKQWTVKRSRGIDDHEVDSWPKRKRTLEHYKSHKIVSKSTADSEDLSKRAAISIEGNWGCVDSKRFASCGGDRHEMGELGSWKKKKRRTLGSFKLQKKISVSAFDSQNLSRRAVVGVEGKWGCVNSKQPRVAVKLSRGNGDGHEIGEMGSWPKRRGTLEPCKLQKQDSENLSKGVEKGRVLERWKDNFEVEIRVVEKVSDQPNSKKTNLLPKKICEGLVELENKDARNGSFAGDSHSEASTTSNLESEEATRKALRAEMIKARFADTIRKAQEQKIISQRKKVEKEILERRKSDKEAEIRASKSMLQSKTPKFCGVVELANNHRTGSLCSDSQPKAFAASNVDSENFTTKALRADMDKSRFDDNTKRKAQEQKNLSQVFKVEKKRLESRKANTEAELRAAECKLKEQRQKEREAARIALENMKTTVEWNHALDIMNEFERLTGTQCSVDRTPFARDRFSW